MWAQGFAHHLTNSHALHFAQLIEGGAFLGAHAYRHGRLLRGAARAVFSNHRPILYSTQGLGLMTRRTKAGLFSYVATTYALGLGLLTSL